MSIFSWIRKTFGTDIDTPDERFIVQMNINKDRVIEEFTGLEEIQEKHSNYNIELIHECCEGNRREYNGYTWEYR